jgi:His Kinase A (phospho-acceptor) domain
MGSRPVSSASAVLRRGPSPAEIDLLRTFTDQASSQSRTSQELRTPLNAITGFSEVLTERMFGELNEKQDEYLKDIYASGQHLLSLLRPPLRPSYFGVSSRPPRDRWAFQLQFLEARDPRELVAAFAAMGREGPSASWSLALRCSSPSAVGLSPGGLMSYGQS